jgi:hypothetical protein
MSYTGPADPNHREGQGRRAAAAGADARDTLRQLRPNTC